MGACWGLRRGQFWTAGQQEGQALAAFPACTSAMVYLDAYGHGDDGGAMPAVYARGEARCGGRGTEEGLHFLPTLGSAQAARAGAAPPDLTVHA